MSGRAGGTVFEAPVVNSRAGSTVFEASVAGREGVRAASGDPLPVDRILLETLYEDPDLARAHGGSGNVEALFEWLRGLLESFLGTRAAEGFATGGRLLFFALAALFAVLLIGYLLRRLPSRRRRRPGANAAGPTRLASPATHRGLADEAREAGDLREAARQRFLSVLAALEGARLVGYGRHKTNREYVRDLESRVAGAGGPGGAGPATAADASAGAGLRAAFADLVTRFDDAWYGLETIDTAALSTIEAACDRVEAETAGLAAPAAPRHAA